VQREADDEDRRQADGAGAAETPIASPSAKLCRPIAAAMTIPVCSA
jgi:hypothetical protein